MSYSVQMPALGESVTEGTVTRWLKQVGDAVAVDEPLLEVSTDKVDTEIPSPVAGVLEKIVVAEDETAEVGAELAVIADGSETSAAVKPPAQESAVPVPEPTAAPPAVPQSPASPTEHKHAAEQPAADPAPASAPTGTVISLPAMGESVTEGTVTRWLKAVGDEVAIDEPLVEISTDKVDTEVPSPVAGILLEITVGEDETVEVGAQLAIIGDKNSIAAPKAAPAAALVAPTPPAAPVLVPVPVPVPVSVSPAAAISAAPAPSAQRAAPNWQPAAHVETTSYVTPVIRKLATDQGVDLSTVTGTGVGGRIRREDVQDAGAAIKDAKRTAATPPAAPTPTFATSVPSTSVDQPSALIGTTAKLTRIRQSIAKNMLHGLHTAAQLTTVIEVDVTKVANLRAKAKAGFEAREGIKLSFLPFFVKATVEALKLYPVVNSTLSDDMKEITYHGSVNLGIAVDTPRGLIVPVIAEADDLNIAGIARKIVDLAARTRDNKIGPDDLAGGTFTITNTGSVGALFDTPIFVPPQSAILGTGAIVRRPVVMTDSDGGEIIAIRSMAYLAMSYDHRNIDGADASRFLSAIKKRIEAGEFEGDLGL